MPSDLQRRGLLPKGLSVERVELTGDRVLVTPLLGVPRQPVRDAVGFHGRCTFTPPQRYIFAPPLTFNP